MKRIFSNKGRYLAIFAAVVVLLTGCSLFPTGTADSIFRDLNSVTITQEQYDEYEKLKRFAEMNELLEIVEAYYYQEPDVSAMLENAARGLLYGLQDPYTYYYNPQEYADMWADDEGEYAGIGIQIMASYETYLCTITRVFVDTPAQAAGLHKGDILKTVNDLEVTAYTLQEAVDIMRGQVGETVNITIQRGDAQMDFVIPRAVIHVNYVSSMMLDDQIGYIALYEFSGDCSAMFSQQLDELIAAGAKGVVIDLRDNPGGWVDDAVKLADIFLPECMVTYMEDRYGARQTYTATAGALELPLVALINENSASSSELLAGALQDYGRATLVGTTTFGKGIVQYVLPVGQDGAGMQLTAEQYYTPNGNAVHKVGITPDIISELPEGADTITYELGDMNDTQLKDAYEAMQKLLETSNAVKALLP